MTEQQAIEFCLGIYGRHLVPADNKEGVEMTIIQLVGDIYRQGYRIVPDFQVSVTLGDIEQMRKDDVVY